MQRIDYRKVLEDNGAGKVKVEVQQVQASTFCLQSNMLCVMSLHVHGILLLIAVSWHMQSEQVCLRNALLMLKHVMHSGWAVEVFGLLWGVCNNLTCPPRQKSWKGTIRTLNAAPTLLLSLTCWHVSAC